MSRTASRDTYYGQSAQSAQSAISADSLWDALCNRIAKAFCRRFHHTVSLPVNSKYRCLTCLREFDTEW